MTRLVHGAASHVGLVRHQNEDSYISGDGLYAVCDGMGGARAGEVASEAACRALLDLEPYSAGPDDLLRSVERANDVILRRSLEDPALRGMGTTLTAAVAKENGILIAHVGDSRAYLLRDGELRQVTDDHSLVGEMMRRGQLTEKQAAAHPHRSVITRALGTDRDVEPDLIDLDLAPGDRVLLCSDGVSGMVRPDELARILDEGDDPQTIAEAVVDAALVGGGEDNATVVVVLALADPDPEADEGEISGSAAGDERRPPVVGPERRTPGNKEEERTADPPSRRARLRSRRDRLRRRTVAFIVGGALVVVLLFGVGLTLFNSSVYWVGTYDSRVALFQGMPYAVLGKDLYHVVEVSPADYSPLPPYLKQRVDAHDLTSKEAGQRLIRGLPRSP
jgi:serine/threonine protein phosphatase PrpC